MKDEALNSELVSIQLCDTEFCSSFFNIPEPWRLDAERTPNGYLVEIKSFINAG